MRDTGSSHPEYELPASAEAYTSGLLEEAFDVILEGFARVKQRSPERFRFNPEKLRELRQQKRQMVQHYQHAAVQRHMDRAGVIRHMRNDLRDQLT